MTLLLIERGKALHGQRFCQMRLGPPASSMAACPGAGFGIWQNTLLNGMMILHGSGVGGGSLVFSNVLMEPDDKLFGSSAWRHLADWKKPFCARITIRQNVCSG